MKRKLGETGVGKSTFVNAFYNYINFKSLEDAIASQTQLQIIESSFHYTDENYKSKKIIVGELKNEMFTEGQSSTQNAQDYGFMVDGKIIRIIDTPGNNQILVQCKVKKCTKLFY